MRSLFMMGPISWKGGQELAQFFLGTSDGAPRVSLTIVNTGAIYLTANGSLSSASATTIKLATNYYVWMHFLSGGTCELFKSETPTRPGPSDDGVNGAVYLSKTGANSTVTRVSVYNGYFSRGDFIFDKVLVSIAEIGNNP